MRNALSRCLGDSILSLWTTTKLQLFKLLLFPAQTAMQHAYRLRDHLQEIKRSIYTRKKASQPASRPPKQANRPQQRAEHIRPVLHIVTVSHKIIKSSSGLCSRLTGLHPIYLSICLLLQDDQDEQFCSLGTVGVFAPFTIKGKLIHVWDTTVPPPASQLVWDLETMKQTPTKIKSFITLHNPLTSCARQRMRE